MSAQQTRSRAPAPRQIVMMVGVFALAAVVAGAMLILAIYVSGVSARSAQQAAELAGRIDALTESQKLIVAQLGAEHVATATAPAASAPTKSGRAATSVVPFHTTAAESNLGVNVAIVRFTNVGALTPAGPAVTIRYGSYLDGAVGYGVAVSRGDVFQGSYYVDETTATAQAKLLRGAPVTVYDWNGARPASEPTQIAATDLARVLVRADATGQRWRDAWFWIKIGRQGEILAAVETPPR